MKQIEWIQKSEKQQAADGQRVDPTLFNSITTGINKILNHHVAVNPTAKLGSKCFFH